jgi:hypothetical protein
VVFTCEAEVGFPNRVDGRPVSYRRELTPARQDRPTRRMASQPAASPENFAALINDVKPRPFDVLLDDTWFYPGHGDDSTLGEQKPHIDEWPSRGW